MKRFIFLFILALSSGLFVPAHLSAALVRRDAGVEEFKEGHCHLSPQELFTRHREKLEALAQQSSHGSEIIIHSPEEFEIFSPFKGSTFRYFLKDGRIYRYSFKDKQWRICTEEADTATETWKVKPGRVVSEAECPLILEICKRENVLSLDTLAKRPTKSPVPTPPASEMFKSMVAAYAAAPDDQEVGDGLDRFRGKIFSSDATHEGPFKLLKDAGTNFAVYNRRKSPNGSEKEVLHWFVLKNNVVYMLDTETDQWHVVEPTINHSGAWEAGLSQPLSAEECAKRSLPENPFILSSELIGAGAAASKHVTGAKITYVPGTHTIASVTPLDLGDSDHPDNPDHPPKEHSPIPAKDLLKAENKEVVETLKKHSPALGQRLEKTLADLKQKVKQEPTITRLTTTDPNDATKTIWTLQSLIAAAIVSTLISTSEYSQSKHEPLWTRSAHMTKLSKIKSLLQRRLAPYFKNSPHSQKALAALIAALATWGVKEISKTTLVHATSDELQFIPDITNISLLALNGYSVYALARYMLTPEKIGSEAPAEELMAG